MMLLKNIVFYLCRPVFWNLLRHENLILEVKDLKHVLEHVSIKKLINYFAV